MVLIATGCGLAGALGAVIFRIMIRFFQALAFEGFDGIHEFYMEGFLAEAHDPLEIASQLEWYWRLAIPAAGGLIVGPMI